jgi:ABC-type glycerol-3-phosphate transport system permease component
MRVPSNLKLIQKILSKIFAYLILTAGALVMVAPFFWNKPPSFKPDGFVVSPPYKITVYFVLEN